MKTLLCLIVLMLLWSCSSGQKEENNELEFEFDSISNEDFKTVDETPYKEYEDVYEETVTSNVEDALARESIARLPEPKLEVVTNKVSNIISKGISLCYRRQFDQAFEVFDKTYLQYKNHPSYWNQVGTCYFLKGELKKAFLYYNKARDINPNYVPAINNHGVIYQQEGDYYKAMKIYEKAANLNSFVMTPLFNMGQLYLRYGFADKAREIFKSLLSKNQGDFDAVNGLAMSYFLSGNAQSALSYWQKMDPKHLKEPYIGLNYCVALKMAGRKNEAVVAFENIEDKKLGSLSNYYKKVKSYVGAE